MKKLISLLMIVFISVLLACGKGDSENGGKKTGNGKNGGDTSQNTTGENPHKLDKEFFKTYYQELGKILEESAADADKAGELGIKWIEENKDKVDELNKYVAWFDTKEWMEWSKKNANLLMSVSAYASGMMKLGKKSPKYMQSKKFSKFLQMQIRPGQGKK